MTEKMLLTTDLSVNKIEPRVPKKRGKEKLRKWLVALEENQHEWLKATTQETGVNGSAIMRTLIDREMKRPSGDIKGSLVAAKLESELKALRKKKAALEARENAIRARLKNKKPNGEKKANGLEKTKV